MEPLIVENVSNSIEQINNLLEKMNSNLITKEEYQQLQQMLIEYIAVGQILSSNEIRNYCDKIKEYPICRTIIDGSKHLYISDTHLGYELETPGLLMDVCSFGISQNVDHIIHLGDLIEGVSRNNEKTPEELKNEIDRAFSFLPTEVEIDLLVGNHDFYAFRRYPSLISKYFDKDNINVLGMSQVLVDWQNYGLMSMDHKIKRITVAKNKAETAIDLYGHYHTYQVYEKERGIHLPTLSEDDNSYELTRQFGLRFSEHPTFMISEIVSPGIVLFRCYNERMELYNEFESNSITRDLRRVRTY